MYLLYSILFSLALVVIIPLYFIKLRLGRGEPLYLRERFGFGLPSRMGEKPFIWIHAVSVGEVLSLQNLVREIKGRFPGCEIGLSSLTNMGHSMAAAKIKDADHLYFIPFDLGWSVRRYFRRLRPDLLVLAESEFWPRLLRESDRRKCPVLLVNGRISERSYGRFRRLGRLARPLLGKIDRFLVQTDQDRDRLERIGVPADRIEVSGNLKCETRLPQFGESELLQFKRDLGIPPGKKVVVAGSIHKGEEKLLLDAFGEARKVREDVLLVLAPRHPEKFGEMEKSFESRSFVFRRRTQGAFDRKWDVLILDTIGELAHFYAISDVAFIGGSLVPWGGQNLLEPAFYGKPVFFGPHMDNFAALAEEFLSGGAARIVDTPEALASLFLFKDLQALQEMGTQAKRILTSLQGATEKTLAALEYLMSHDNRPKQ